MPALSSGSGPDPLLLRPGMPDRVPRVVWRPRGGDAGASPLSCEGSGDAGASPPSVEGSGDAETSPTLH